MEKVALWLYTSFRPKFRDPHTQELGINDRLGFDFIELLAADGFLLHSFLSIAVQAVGMIVSPHQAEAIIAGDHADFVALARGFLDDPRWAWHAAAALGADPVYPPQYRRARPAHWPDAALARAQQRGNKTARRSPRGMGARV